MGAQGSSSAQLPAWHHQLRDAYGGGTASAGVPCDCSCSSIVPGATAGPSPRPLLVCWQTPAWLEQMIAHTTWRDLFYKLAEAHPDCLMLNFTVKVGVPGRARRKPVRARATRGWGWRFSSERSHLLLVKAFVVALQSVLTSRRKSTECVCFCINMDSGLGFGRNVFVEAAPPREEPLRTPPSFCTRRLRVGVLSPGHTPGWGRGRGWSKGPRPEASASLSLLTVNTDRAALSDACGACCRRSVRLLVFVS